MQRWGRAVHALPLLHCPFLVIRPAPAHPFLPVPVDKPEGCGVFRKGSLAADDHGDTLSVQQVLNSDFSWRRYPGDDLAENILNLVSMLALSNPDTPTASVTTDGFSLGRISLALQGITGCHLPFLDTQEA